MQDEQNEKIEKNFPKAKTYLLLAVAGIAIGVIVGLLEVFFGETLRFVTGIREEYALFLLPLLPLGGLLIVFLYKKLGANTQRGMSLIFAVGHAKEEKIPWRLIPLAMISTWLTHLFGGSAGREGVAVQIGATVSHGIGRKLAIKNTSKIFLITGMAAGFAGLFETPLAAIFFSLEVLVAGELALEALLPAALAAFTAWGISSFLGFEKFTFNLVVSVEFSVSFVCKLLLLGVIFGVMGSLFARILKGAKNFFANKIKNPYIRIFSMGIILSALLLLLYKGRYSGLGTNLIEASFHQGTLYSYDWVFKFLLTIFTLSIGFQGGEVTPLFSIGASLGFMLASFFGLPVELCAALGFAGVFAGATNTLFCPILLGLEVFGYKNFPYFLIVCVISYFCNQNQSIYKEQKRRPLFSRNKKEA